MILTVVLGPQATIQGFESKGFSKEQSENLLTKSVQIALEAREMFLKEHLEKSTPIQHPILVAAALGSYGAYLADGSEYRYLQLLNDTDHVFTYSCQIFTSVSL